MLPQIELRLSFCEISFTQVLIGPINIHNTRMDKYDIYIRTEQEMNMIQEVPIECQLSHLPFQVLNDNNRGDKYWFQFVSEFESCQELLTVVLLLLWILCCLD